MSLWRTLRVTNNLRYSIAIADIEEDQSTMISPAVHPTGERYLLSNIILI
jgi:hypothetical protein